MVKTERRSSYDECIILIFELHVHVLFCLAVIVAAAAAGGKMVMKPRSRHREKKDAHEEEHLAYQMVGEP